jgi:CHAT domain-containing protein/Tfp pilus assembly protein PilF
MTQCNKRRPALELRRKRDAYQALTSLSALLLFFSLTAAIPSRQAVGNSHGLFRQSNQQPPGVGSGGRNEKDVRALEAGRPIKSELAGGQEHVYRINLGTDQFLKVIIEQQGIDVVVQVSGPDGKQILEFDSESRSQGQEDVSLAPEVGGAFLLTVRPKLNGTPAGSYEIRIEELRVATDTDRALHEAREQFEEALKLRHAGKYDEALPLVERALEIRERLLGPEHRDVDAAIDSLARIYTSKGEYVKAEPLYRRALAIREKALGKENPDTGASLNNLAELYYYQGKYMEAEPLHKRALDIREKALGKDHPTTAISLNNLASLYYSQGKYVEAEPLLKRALDIREKALGKENPDTGASLSNLAGLYLAQGKYVEAEPLHKRALDIREKRLGKDHPTTAISLDNLAILYYSQGKYVEAEPLHKRALDIREKALGKDHPTTAISLNNLASLYYSQGKYVEAEPLHKRALDIREKALGKENPNTAISLDNLANLYRAQGKYVEAEPLHKRALDIKEKALGKDHPKIAISLDNLAILYQEQGKYVEAEPLHKRALDIREKALGKDHPDTAISLDNLASLYYLQGKYVETEPLLKRALDIFEKALGKDHPNTAISLDNLAALYAAKGDLVQAVKFQLRANAASERNLARNLVIGSERTKLAYLATLSAQADRTISLHLRSAPSDPAPRNLAATLILQRKGRALDATSQNLNALRSRFNAEDQALLDRLTETRSQIARLVLRGPQRMAAEQHQARIKKLEDQAEKDQADISRRSDEFRAQYLSVTMEAVRAAIPSDSALIEFVSYRPFNAKATKADEAYGQPRYVAYVLRHEGEIEWKELGEAKAIDTAIAALRKALRNPNRSDVKSLARAVDERVFQPVRPLLGEQTRLLISPDGQLNLIPFAALVDEQGRYLVERYSISYLTSGRDLLRLQVARESKGGPLVVAAPDFGRRSQVGVSSLEKQEKDASEGKVKEESARSVIGEFDFTPLPYAAREGEALRALLPGPTLLTKGQATKTALGQARSPMILHVATHGFFLEDLNLALPGGRGYQALAEDPRQVLTRIEESGIRVESPLLRSGLALAGANEPTEEDNGILTALEVTGLNLWGTKLVVLSACDTGVGEVKNGDGVHGLRRALTLAGSETQVMSLWAVKDKATRDLMVAYYRKLKEGEGRGEALRQAQLEMLKQAPRRHPFYWASFIQSGEWANLDGRR